VPSWLALPPVESPTVLTDLGLRQLPSLASDGSPFDRPFRVDGLPCVATLGERRATYRVAKEEMMKITAATFNAVLGTGELSLGEGEQWMLTHDTHHNNLCKEGLPCFDQNHHVDNKTGKKRAPQRKELHKRDCLQRRCLEVQNAVKKGQRVARPKK
jgi:hypothetical protein